MVDYHLRTVRDTIDRTRSIHAYREIDRLVSQDVEGTVGGAMNTRSCPAMWMMHMMVDELRAVVGSALDPIPPKRRRG